MAITLIQTITIGAGGSASIDFSSIPQTPYTDLMVAYSVRGTNASQGVDLWLRFNGSSAAAYSERMLYGNGSSALSASSAVGASAEINWGLADGANSTANTFSSGQIYIPNYTALMNKAISEDSVTETNAAAALTYINAALWTNTAAITSLSLIASVGTLVQYSTASLYGITKGSYPGVTVA